MPIVFCEPQSWGAFKRGTIAKKVRAFPVSTAYEIGNLVQSGKCIPQDLLLDAIAQLANEQAARPLAAELRKWARSAKPDQGLQGSRSTTKSKKIKGTFCEKRFFDKRNFAPQSFRWKKSGKAWILVACPKDKWQPIKQRCKVGMKLHVLLSPAKGKKCTDGTKRITK